MYLLFITYTLSQFLVNVVYLFSLPQRCSMFFLRKDGVQMLYYPSAVVNGEEKDMRGGKLNFRESLFYLDTFYISTYTVNESMYVIIDTNIFPPLKQNSLQLLVPQLISITNYTFSFSRN